jgi:hypothetical protein
MRDCENLDFVWETLGIATSVIVIFLENGVFMHVMEFLRVFQI